MKILQLRQIIRYVAELAKYNRVFELADRGIASGKGNGTALLLAKHRLIKRLTDLG